MIGIVCAVIDCEVKGVNVGTRCPLLRVVECVCSGSSISSVVPSEFVTGSLMVYSIVVLGDGEEQCIRARASVGVCVVVGVSTAFVVGNFMPCELFASILVVGIVCAVVDS